MSCRTVTDQMGREVKVPASPERIISLVPSQTELLFYLGCQHRIVGRTKYCIRPARDVDQVPIMGGTKRFRFNKIEAQAPDLILGNKEENYQQGIEQLAKNHPVWMSDILTLDDALAMIANLGNIVGKADPAQTLVEEIKRRFTELPKIDPPVRVAYLIWRKPYMAAGKPTFIDNLLTRCGLINIVTEADGRYPQISIEELRERAPDRVLLSSEPFPFQDKHHQELLDAWPEAAIEFVDGQAFSWYGIRLLAAADYFHALLGRWHGDARA